MTRIFAIITIVLLILTLGCGFAIRYGGEAFKDAVNGHMVLAVLTLISVIILCIIGGIGTAAALDILAIGSVAGGAFFLLALIFLVLNRKHHPAI